MLMLCAIVIESPTDWPTVLPSGLAGVPPPDSSPPRPPATTPEPTDANPPEFTASDNQKRFSSNDGNYAHPTPRQPLSKSRDSAKSSPALTGGKKYQDIRVSRLNYEHMYTVAKTNPKYINVPNNKS